MTSILKYKHMKKILLIIVVLIGSFAIHAQTIQDRFGYIQINKPNDTAYIAKTNIDKIVNYFGTIYIMYNSIANNNALLGYYQLKVIDFSQFTNAVIMLDYLKKSAAENYEITYHYTGSNMDTAYYYISAALQYKKAFTYVGANVTKQEIIY